MMSIESTINYYQNQNFVTSLAFFSKHYFWNPFSHIQSLLLLKQTDSIQTLERISNSKSSNDESHISAQWNNKVTQISRCPAALELPALLAQFIRGQPSIILRTFISKNSGGKGWFFCENPEGVVEFLSSRATFNTVRQ